MNTNQTPEEKQSELTVRKFMLKKFPTNEWMDCPVPKHHWETIQEYADKYSQSLSTEIERLKGERQAALDTLRGESQKVKELELKLSGKTFSCPVCDSMAERNRGLESAIEQVKNKVQFQSSVYALEINSICEQLLSNQNNKK